MTTARHSVRPSLALALFSLTGLAYPANAADQPDHYVLAIKEFGGWNTQSRVLVSWNRDKPVMTGLECIVTHDRQLQTDKPPMEIGISHPVESADFKFRFTFNLPDADLIDRKVETITVGGRPYQVKSVQSRIVPWFGLPDGDILLYGYGRTMFRPTETYPWLPLEFLIPQFFEVEGITLGISGQFEIKHGDYEKRYEELYIRMDDFKEALGWCYEQVNPSGSSKVSLPPELNRAIQQ